ncbi:hypothetical protein BLOT_016078, partial [Blomia tropicalis]
INHCPTREWKRKSSKTNTFTLKVHKVHKHQHGVNNYMISEFLVAVEKLHWMDILCQVQQNLFHFLAIGQAKKKQIKPDRKCILPMGIPFRKHAKKTTKGNAV